MESENDSERAERQATAQRQAEALERISVNFATLTRQMEMVIKLLRWIVR